MNKTDYLIACLGEECGEVQQVVGKIFRFGLLDINPKGIDTNLVLLTKEIHDILSVYQMLCKEIDMDFNINTTLLEYKKERVTRYMQYSKDVGRLDK